MKETYTKEETVQLLSGALGEFVTRLIGYSEQKWPEEDQEKLKVAINEVLNGIGGKMDVQGSE